MALITILVNRQLSFSWSERMNYYQLVASSNQNFEFISFSANNNTECYLIRWFLNYPPNYTKQIEIKNVDTQPTRKIQQLRSTSTIIFVYFLFKQLYFLL